MMEKIREQILAIRDSGITNMFDLNRVQYEANKLNFFELVVFIEENKDKYVNFIITGKF